MRKLLFFILFLPLWVMAQTVKSPNGTVELKFSLVNGVPTYEMS